MHCALLVAATLAVGTIPRILVASQKRRSDNGWMADLSRGVAAKWRIPVERGWTLVNFVVCICFMPAVGMLLPLKIKSLGLSGAWLGGCEAMLSVGLLAGALGVSARVANYLGRYYARLGALVFEGVALSLAGFLQQPWVLLVAFGAVGLGMSVLQLVGQTHRLLAIPEAYRGRMTAVNAVTIQVANSVGPALAAIALAHYDLTTVYTAAGLGVIVCTGGYFFVPDYKHFLSLDHDAVSNWYGREYPHVFEPEAANV
jgi:hypothetical protein